VVNSARFARQVDAALKPILAADDRLIASARLVSGPPPAPVAFGLAFLNAGIWATAGIVANRLTTGAFASSAWTVAALALPATVVLAVIACCLQRPMFLAVSRQQLICARLTAGRQRPVRMVTVPLSAARIDSYRSGPNTTSITIDLPGTGRLHLHGYRKQKSELDNVLMPARMAGVPIGAARRRGRRSTATPTDYGPSLAGLPRWSRWPEG
jgi:hypothetical protein